MTETAFSTPLPTVEESIELVGFGRFQVILLSLFGIIQVFIAAQMMLLSILGPALQCNWKLSNSEIAFITTSFFMGNMIGAPIWGRLSDYFGRKSIIIVSLLFVSYTAFLCALAPTYGWMTFLRFVIGFSVSGMSASTPLVSEFIPKRYRARSLMVFSLSWTLGTILIVSVSYATVLRFGWRWLVGFTVFPLALSALSFLWIPKSPRHLHVTGKLRETIKVLQKISKTNHQSKNVRVMQSEERADFTFKENIASLIVPRYRWTTAIIFFLWFGCGFTYYGSVLTAVELPNFDHQCLGTRQSRLDFQTDTNYSSCCSPFTYQSFLDQMIAASGEFLSFAINLILLDSIGRKVSIFLNAVVGCVFFFVLNFCLSQSAEAVVLLVIRAATNGLYSILFIYVAEVYPTSVRALAIGCCSAVSRIGGILTPFVAQVLLRSSLYGAVSIYALTLFIMAVVTLGLTIETKNRALLQTIYSKSPGTPQENYMTFDQIDKTELSN